MKLVFILYMLPVSVSFSEVCHDFDLQTLKYRLLDVFCKM